MADEAWRKLHDGATFKVYDDPGSWWDPFRYTVAEPDGRVLTSTVTLWGARRAIRRAIRRASTKPWWETPIVEEVGPPGGDR